LLRRVVAARRAPGSPPAESPSPGLFLLMKINELGGFVKANNHHGKKISPVIAMR
jgi:hypothetical protein